MIPQTESRKAYIRSCREAAKFVELMAVQEALCLASADFRGAAVCADMSELYSDFAFSLSTGARNVGWL